MKNSHAATIAWLVEIMLMGIRLIIHHARQYLCLHYPVRHLSARGQLAYELLGLVFIENFLVQVLGVTLGKFHHSIHTGFFEQVCILLAHTLYTKQIDVILPSQYKLIAYTRCSSKFFSPAGM